MFILGWLPATYQCRLPVWVGHSLSDVLFFCCCHLALLFLPSSPPLLHPDKVVWVYIPVHPWKCSIQYTLRLLSHTKPPPHIGLAPPHTAYTYILSGPIQTAPCTYIPLRTHTHTNTNTLIYFFTMKHCFILHWTTSERVMPPMSQF